MLKNKNISFCRFIIAFGLYAALTVMLTSCSATNQPMPIIEGNTQTYHSGKFVWHDLVTSDVVSTKDFYGQLFHWTFETNGRYTTILLDNKRIGGIVDVQPKDAEFHVARWILSLSVPDVDSAVDQVLDSNGTVLRGPEQIGDRGVVALVSDPQGAQLSLIHTITGDPSDGPAQNNSWLWHELWTKNPVESIQFYKQLASYTSVEDLDSYWILKNENKWRAGIRHLINPALEQRWVPVIKVVDAQAVSALAKKIGGKVVIETENPDYNDDAALLADPSGALFLIQEWTGLDEIEDEDNGEL